MSKEGYRKELNCTKCQKATIHTFETVGMIPDITRQWRCSICDTVILEKEVKMKASPKAFLEYLYQYSGVSGRESIRASLEVIADVFDVPLWTAAKIMRRLKKDELVKEFRGPRTLVGDERFEITRKGIKFLESEPS
jgi:hypothetical protein